MLELDWHTPLTSILAWNPWLGSESTCTENLYANLTTDWRAFCIGVNQTVPTSTVSMGTSASSTTSNSPPGPTVGGMAPGCSELYTVQSGDYCAAICAQFSISFSQFLSWNPASMFSARNQANRAWLTFSVVGSNCENLWLGYSYCVGVPPASSTSEPPPTSTPPPLREGTPTDCTTYHLVVSGDSCGAIQSQYSITFTQLYGWNPSIGSNCESLWLGYGVCVAR
jgi:LysM repeat protein